jgi:hypothetical protein
MISYPTPKAPPGARAPLDCAPSGSVIDRDSTHV